MSDVKPEGQISIGGNVDGQIAIGNHNVQVQQIRPEGDAANLAELDPQTAVTLKHIMQGLQTTFSLSEMRLLCLSLRLNPAVLNNTTIVDMAHDLTMYAYRHNLLDDLVKICQTERPHYGWTAVA